MRVPKILITGLAALLLTYCTKEAPVKIPPKPAIEAPYADMNAYPPVEIGPVFHETKQLGIYYGWPSDVNGSSGDALQAAESFRSLDYLVLGAKLEESGHPDHQNTQQIIDLIKKNTKVFGYVDIGDSKDTSDFTLEQIEAKVNNWKEMGVYGIFYDDAYYGYNVDKKRLTDTINIVNKAGLKLMLNCSDIAWAISTGAVKKGKEGHSLLVEPFMVSKGEYLPKNQIEQLERKIHYFITKGYAFHGIGHYADNQTDETKKKLAHSLRLRASQLGIESATLSPYFYAASGKDANRLFYYKN